MAARRFSACLASASSSGFVPSVQPLRGLLPSSVILSAPPSTSVRFLSSSVFLPFSSEPFSSNDSADELGGTPATDSADELGGSPAGNEFDYSSISSESPSGASEFEQPTTSRVVEEPRVTTEETARTLFVGGLKWHVDEPLLKRIFEPYGTVDEAKVLRTRLGRSRGFGFVTFSTAEEADSAVEKTDGMSLGDDGDDDEAGPNTLTVKKSHGKVRSRPNFNDGRSFSKTRLFVGGLADTTSSQDLQERFEQFGEVVNAFVIPNPTRNFGFVSFATPEAASAARQAMHQTVIDGCIVAVKSAIDKPRTEGGFGGDGDAPRERRSRSTDDGAWGDSSPEVGNESGDSDFFSDDLGSSDKNQW